LAAFFTIAPFILKYFPLKCSEDLFLLSNNIWRSCKPSSNIETLSAFLGYSTPYGYHHCVAYWSFASAPALNSHLPLDIS
jgi:hypothetical protein